MHLDLLLYREKSAAYCERMRDGRVNWFTPRAISRAGASGFVDHAAIKTAEKDED
jgi:hypothetical protein